MQDSFQNPCFITTYKQNKAIGIVLIDKGAIISRILIEAVPAKYSVDMSTYMYMHMHTSLLHSRDTQPGFSVITKDSG